MIDSFNPASSFYRLEAGGAPGGHRSSPVTARRWWIPVTKMPHLLTVVRNRAASAPGNYYVRVRGVNNGVAGPASNEIVVPVTGGVPGTGGADRLHRHHAW